MSYRVPYSVHHERGGTQTGAVRVIADTMREAVIKAAERVQWSTGEPADRITIHDPQPLG